MGFDPVRVVTYNHQKGFQEKHRDQVRQIAPPDKNPLHKLAQFIDLQQPHFFLISPDLNRDQADEDLPLFTFIQPGKEIVCNNGAITEINGFEDFYLQEEKTGTKQNSIDYSLLLPPSLPQDAWNTELDAIFIQRLKKAIAQLQDVEEKMIVMRGFNKAVRENLDIAELYKIYSSLEPDCAAGHIAYFPNRVVSLGRSPENVFEIEGNQLCFDVMASTRGISKHPQKDSILLNELKTDPKEKREHEIAIQHFKNNMLKVCQDGEVTIEKMMKVRTFRNVRHLHSRLSATIEDNCSYLDIIHNSFPPLQSYTKDLVQLSDTIKEPLRYYGGMVGYLNGSKSVAKCFLNIRSLLRSDNTLYTHGGVGVMKESVAENEHLEVKNKLRCLMESVKIWENC